MRIGFVVNEPAQEDPRYPTVELVRAAGQFAHEPWIMGVADVVYAADGSAAERQLSVQVHSASRGQLQLDSRIGRQ